MRTDFSQFGYEIFGPFLLGFSRWLTDRINEIRPDKVFFLSRDGFLMQQGYEILNNGLATPPAEYAYFSRRSLRSPLLWTKPEFGDDLEFMSWQRYVSFAEMLSFWDIEDEEEKIRQETGIDPGKEYVAFESITSDKRLEQIYNSRKDLIISRSKAQYDNLKAYFEQIGMRGKVVIADIGWHGTMQYCLEQMLATCGIEAEVTGLYVGIDCAKPIKGPVDGYVYNTQHQENRTRILCFLGGVEKLFQSFEGSTKGYAVGENGVITPELAPYEFEAGDPIIAEVKEFQKGALDFMRENPDFSGDCLSPIFRCGANPTAKELEMFSDFYNIDNGEKLFYLPQKSIFRYSPGEFKLALSQSTWKTGFLKKALFRLPLPYHAIYCLLKK